MWLKWWHTNLKNHIAIKNKLLYPTGYQARYFLETFYVRTVHIINEKWNFFLDFFFFLDSSRNFWHTKSRKQILHELLASRAVNYTWISYVLSCLTLNGKTLFASQIQTELAAVSTLPKPWKPLPLILVLINIVHWFSVLVPFSFLWQSSESEIPKLMRHRILVSEKLYSTLQNLKVGVHTV